MAKYPGSEADPVANAALTAHEADASAHASLFAEKADDAATTAALATKASLSTDAGDAGKAIDAHTGAPLPVGSSVGTHAARPTSAVVGAEYFESDTSKMFRYDGAAWVQIGALAHAELGYAELMSNAPASAVATTALTDIGLSLTVPVTDRPIIVEFHAYFITSAAGFNVVIREDGVIVGRGGANAVSTGIASHVTARRAPAAGQHTYNVQLARVAGSGSTQIIAPGDAPAASLHIREC